MSGKLCYYVSFLLTGHVYNCVAEVQSLEDANHLFEVYSDHLHYHGFKQIKNDPFTESLKDKVATFEKDGEHRRVVLDVIEE
jgi:hypothetical protein